MEKPDSSEPFRRRLPPGQQLVAAGRWPLVGERMSSAGTAPWSLQLAGAVQNSLTLSLEQFANLPQSEIITDIHCVTRWSKYDVRFRGVLLQELVARCQPETNARFVSFVARTGRKHSSSLPLNEALSLGTLLVTGVNGQPLPPEHGGPLRSVVPGKYFYKSVKWVERIDFLAEDRLGYWESEAGYHNGADPWREERYIAATIDRREAARLIESRDFTGRDLLSLDARERELSGLQAAGALLRNARFDATRLVDADFRDANLSNASFRKADLLGANFAGADLEGADFALADLRGADLRGCSLFGASFCDAGSPDDSIDAAARIDATTRIDAPSLDRLVDVQREFVLRCVAGNENH